MEKEAELGTERKRHLKPKCKHYWRHARHDSTRSFVIQICSWGRFAFLLHLLLCDCARLLHHEIGELLVERARRRDPHADDDKEHHGKVRCRRRERAEGKDETLLDEGPTRLAERVTDHIDGGFTLGFLLGIEGNVGHLFAGIEQGVLGGLAHHVLRRSNQDCCHQGCCAKVGDCGGELRAEQDQGEETKPGDTQDGGGNHGRDSPSKLTEDESSYEHHGKGDTARGRRKIAHKGGVVVGVRKRCAELGFPGNFHDIDRHPIGNDKHGKIADVLGAGQVLCRLSQRELGPLLFLGLLARLEHRVVRHDDAIHVRKTSDNDEASQTYH
mmetsp:Transcript_11847/g.24138  ORF Transcript_11847/g.24138 Transcript_11847/m.24138 type:complete len:327 (+) Transcript_11847:195-1175(+)